MPGGDIVSRLITWITWIILRPIGVKVYPDPPSRCAVWAWRVTDAGSTGTVGSSDFSAEPPLFMNDYRRYNRSIWPSREGTAYRI